MSLKKYKKFTRGYYLLGIASIIFVGYSMICVFYHFQDVLRSDRLMPVRAVVVDGVLKYLSRKDIADITGRTAAGSNITTLDTEEVRSALMQNPWIASASVKKKMPDTLDVSVVEHVPAAYFNHGLFDAKTREPFYPNMRDFKEPLIKLEATHDYLAPTVYDQTVKFISEFQNTPYEVVKVKLDSARGYHVTLSNGIELRLGRDEAKNPLSQRIKTFIEAFSKTDIDVNNVEYVDLRYDSGFSIGWKNK